MLERARELTPDPAAIGFRRADLAAIELPEASYDVAYSALVVHYLADLGRFVARVHAALRPGGSLVLSTEHPIFMAPSAPLARRRRGRPGPRRGARPAFLLLAAHR